MKNYACWRAADAHVIINPDVDALPDYIFRAVHTDLLLHVRSSKDAPLRNVTLNSFLNDFLSHPGHALVPIIGESGTGKSHLVRWMKLRLPETDTRRVIFVPKAQTNLREILRMLIAVLPADEQQPFVQALQGAGGTVLTKNAQRTAILNNIQLALVNDLGDPSSGIDPAMEQFLIPGLSAMFSDPYVRTHLLRDGGFAADLAAHVYEKPDAYTPAEARRVFTKSDLPLDIGNIRRAAATTQSILTYLVSQPDTTAIQAATDIVNRHVDWAIGQCVNMTGDRLIELMMAIRRSLKRKKTLILLIEDFARLQGLDYALMQILIEHSREDLCELRTAFACTTGFYNTLRDTVGTRLTSVVDMDVPLGSSENGIDLSRMVGHYMNALRRGSDELHTDWKRHSKGEIGFDVKNRCESCEYQETCHASFGRTADGHGLYPFTERALNVMAHRAVPDADKKFNMRSFQKNVLLPIVGLQPKIEAGSFPPSELLSDLGGVQSLGPAERRRIEEKARQQAPRYISLYELWDGSAELRDLPNGIEGFFGLSPIGWGDAAQQRRDDDEVVPPPPPPPPPLGDPRLSEIDKWEQSQTKLSATTAQKLRDLVFDAIVDAIDWDEVGLARNEFAGRTSDFRPGSIYFENQATTRVAHNVSLTIPANWQDKEERYRTVMALQGILQAGSEFDWTFKDGSEKLACLLECLKDWGAGIVEQIFKLDQASANWDPAASAFELRCAAVMLTTPNLVIRDDADLVRVAVGPLGNTGRFITKNLNDIATAIKEAEKTLDAAILSRHGALKGGLVSQVSENKFMEATKLLDLAAGFRNRGYSQGLPPEDQEIKSETRKQSGKLARDVAKNLQKALQDEMKSRREWQADMAKMFGANATREQIVGAAVQVGDAATRLGITGTHEFNTARVAFESVPYDEMLAAGVPEPGQEKLTDAAVDILKTVQTSKAFLTSFGNVLKRVEDEVRGRLETGGINPDEEEALLKGLKANFTKVYALLSAIGKEHVNAG